MGFFLFNKKKKKKKDTIRDIAKERMKGIIERQRKEQNKEYSIPLNVNPEEISNLIKDYAQRRLNVSKSNVKVHMTKDDKSLTIVANILFYRR